MRTSDFSCTYYNSSKKKCEAIDYNCIRTCKDDCSICEHFDYTTSELSTICKTCLYERTAERLKKKIKTS